MEENGIFRVFPFSRFLYTILTIRTSAILSLLPHFNFTWVSSNEPFLRSLLYETRTFLPITDRVHTYPITLLGNVERHHQKRAPCSTRNFVDPTFLSVCT